jgi:hypothetical protein
LQDYISGMLLPEHRSFGHSLTVPDHLWKASIN